MPLGDGGPSNVGEKEGMCKPD